MSGGGGGGGVLTGIGPHRIERPAHQEEVDVRNAGPRKVVLRGKLGAISPGNSGYGLEVHSVVGTLGQEGVTTTDGWGKWARIQRRQLRAATVLEGYEPYTITIPLLLDAVFLGRPDIEQEVKTLEWFGGRGTMFRGQPGQPAQGETPLIELFSESRLVPYWCQSGRAGEGSIIYVLDKMEYNMLGREWVEPLRLPASAVRAGARTRQAVTVTLVEYVGARGATVDSAANRVALLQQQKLHFGKPFIVHDGINTFYRIAAHLNHTDPSNIATAAREIQAANPKLPKSLYRRIKHGTKVRIPESATPRRF